MIELHAHLNGTVRRSTLLELLDARDDLDAQQAADMRAVISATERSLAECFRLFPVIHELVGDSLELLARVTREAVEDLVADGVVYAEIRTTPKGPDERLYVRTVLDAAAAAAEAAGGCIAVRLLLSVNRAEPVAKARRTVALAEELRAAGEHVVGLDLSGNPTSGDVGALVPVLAAAALPVTVHIGEVPGREEETWQLLRMRPARLGHALFLSEEQVAYLRADPIPIEACPTSNSRTTQRALPEHPTLGEWLATDYPVSICTDDCGVFDCSLSSELADVEAHFDVTRERLAELSRRAVEWIFCPLEGTKEWVMGRLDRPS